LRYSIHIVCSSLLALGLAASIALPAFAAEEVAGAAAPLRITLHGEPAATSSIHRDDRLFVPAAFFRRLGVTVGWHSESQSVNLQMDGTRLVLPSGKADVIHRPEGTYIPLRFAAESLGLSVGYDTLTGTVSLQSSHKNTASSGNSSSDKDLYWLEQITEAEAGGEAYEGKIAVAAVILNRVDSPDWPNSIQEVIFQIVEVNGVSYYQFSPVLDGRLYEVTPNAETARAVQAALSGEDPTVGATVFYNPAKTDNRWVRERPVNTTIGNHIFAK
jgi:hypothetical protein